MPLSSAKRVAEVCSVADEKTRTTYIGLAVLLPCIAVGLWWSWELPTPGKGGLLLALVATLMTLFWEKHNVILRSAWIAVLFIIFSVEYRAIDKDRRDFAAEQKNARHEERESFGKLLDKEQTNLDTILKNNNDNLKSILQDQGNNFERILRDNRHSQAQERNDFIALLNKQQDLFTSQQEFSEALSGRLVPGNRPTPANACSGLAPKMSPRDIVVIAGTNAAVTNSFPYSILNISKENVITIDRIDGSGTIALGVESRDQNGRIIFRLNKDGVINNSRFSVLRPNKSTMLLEDEFGREVMRAEFINPHAVTVTGYVFYCGKAVPIELPMFSNNCAGYGGGAISLMLPCTTQQQ
jgi:hypothetical protein